MENTSEDNIRLQELTDAVKEFFTCEDELFACEPSKAEESCRRFNAASDKLRLMVGLEPVSDDM